MLPAQSGLYQRYCYPPSPACFPTTVAVSFQSYSLHFKFFFCFAIGITQREAWGGVFLNKLSDQCQCIPSVTTCNVTWPKAACWIGGIVFYHVLYIWRQRDGWMNISQGFWEQTYHKKACPGTVRPLKIFHLTLPVKEQQAKSDLGPWLCVEYMQGPFRRQRLLVESDQTTSLHASEPNAWTFIICEPLIA